MAKEIPLTKGKVAIVDDADYEWLSQWKWTYTRGYAVHKEAGKYGGKSTRMHRLIMQPPDHLVIDHIDWNPLNNQRSNLRICTQYENMQNRKHSYYQTDSWKNRPEAKTSQYKGVRLAKGTITTPWRAEIWSNRQRIHLGYYATEVEAAIAYNEAAIKYHGEFARLNEIPLDFS